MAVIRSFEQMCKLVANWRDTALLYLFDRYVIDLSAAADGPQFFHQEDLLGSLFVW